jgi:transmembrane 9 superfamily protein 3
VYGYAFYYFFVKTKMSGAFQTTFYFSYMALFAMALGLICGEPAVRWDGLWRACDGPRPSGAGTLGFSGASMFVFRIYKNLKID